MDKLAGHRLASWSLFLELCIMKASALLAAPLLFLSGLVHGQCVIDIPQDTVVLYWGYDPLACATLAPAVNGAAPNTVVWSTGDTSATLTVCDTASSWYTVELTDDTLCTAMDSVFVEVIDVHCGNNGNKVLVCHIPPGNPANAHTICISENGVPAHLAHGCHLGPCDMDNDSLNTTPGQLQLLVSPNPMNAQATVQVMSVVAQHVRLTVVDAMGRRTALLLDEDLPANGVRTVVLDRGQLPGGTTACWVEAQGDFGREVQRVVLVR